MNILNQTQLETARNFHSLSFLSPSDAAKQIKDMPVSVRAAVAYAWSDFITTAFMDTWIWADAEAHEEEFNTITNKLMDAFAPELNGRPYKEITEIIEQGSDILRGYKLDLPARVA